MRYSQIVNCFKERYSQIGKKFEAQPTFAEAPPDYNDLDYRGEFEGSAAKRQSQAGEMGGTYIPNSQSNRQIYSEPYQPQTYQPQRLSLEIQSAPARSISYRERNRNQRLSQDDPCPIWIFTILTCCFSPLCGAIGLCAFISSRDDESRPNQAAAYRALSLVTALSLILWIGLIYSRS